MAIDHQPQENEINFFQQKPPIGWCFQAFGTQGTINCITLTIVNFYLHAITLMEVPYLDPPFAAI